MGNENIANWIEAARPLLDLSDLEGDKNYVAILDTLGLPRHQYCYVPCDQTDSESTRELFNGRSFFCRLMPKSGGPRPYRHNISSVDEFREFCSGYNLDGYSIRLVEKTGLEYTGGIIAAEFPVGTPISCSVELVKGDGHALFHGKEIPIHAEIEFDGVINYSGRKNPTHEERRIVLRALNFIGGPRHPFPGYYEFEIYADGKILFRNYQKPSTPYGNTPLSKFLKEPPVSHFRE